MNERNRELALGLAVIALLVAGIAFDGARGGVTATDSTDAGPLFVERARFCPPPIGEGTRAGVAVAAPLGSTGLVRKEGEDAEITGDKIIALEVSDATSPVGAGTFVSAGAFQRSTTDAPRTAAARCSGVASTHWYFAEGSSALDFDEKIVLYNPFPYEAVVRVTLFTPKGQEARANLAEQPVPAGETTIIQLNKFIRQQRFVGVSISALRGRVVAWKSVAEHAEDRPDGQTLTLGATAASPNWFFPEGEVSPTADERISILNPTDEEAIVNVSLSTTKETIQPPKLVELVVPPRTLTALPLHEYVTGAQSDVGGASVSVRATSGAVVAERIVFYDGGGLAGVAGEIGATDPGTDWMIGPPAALPETDSVVVMNPGAESATFSIVIVRGKGEPLTPPRLTDLRLKAGTRLKIPVGEFTRGRTAIAIVRSDVPIVAERVGSAGGDVAAVMGSKVPREDES
jgi:hypothetical protein